MDWSGLTGGVRFIRHTTGAVVLVVAFIVIIIVAGLYAPIPTWFKLLLVILGTVAGGAIWKPFWAKAKEEPLTATEDYWKTAVPFIFGQQGTETSRDDLLKLPSVTPPKELGTGRQVEQGKAEAEP